MDVIINSQFQLVLTTRKVQSSSETQERKKRKNKKQKKKHIDFAE